VVEDEIAEPLKDLLKEAKLLRDRSGDDSEAAAAIDRIFEDVESIQRRLKNVAEGPASLLGIEDAIRKRSVDPVLAGRRVLVADNEAHIRDTVSELLRARGARVVLCNDGESAIQLLDQWVVSFDADEAFDLVISDINLGDRTGYDVFAAAKRASAELPVILMTGFGYDPHHSIVRASQEGLQCVLFKPFQAEAMITEAKKAIEGEPS
jgi:CheY-like chemotaxis protein